MSDLKRYLSVLGYDPDWKLTCSKLQKFSSVVSNLISELCIFNQLPKYLDDKNFEDFSTNLANFISLYDYLCSEVAAVRSVSAKNSSTTNGVDKHLPEDNDNDLIECVLKIYKSLKLDIPNRPINALTMFQILGNRIDELLPKCPPKHLGKSLILTNGLSDRQWSQINRIAALLSQEYANRQATLLKRLDLTIQSFEWSHKAKSKMQQIRSVYNPIRKSLTQTPFASIPDVLAARDNPLLRVEKTSGRSCRQFTTCDLNKILIGKVPDRGGRAWELEPPPPEMPAFKKRQADNPFGGQRGGGGGGGRGGFHNRGRGDYQQCSNRGGGPGSGGGNWSANSNRMMVGYDAQSNVGFKSSYYSEPGLGDVNMLNQQMMTGLVFEPGLCCGQNVNFVMQPSNDFVSTDRGRGSRGNRRGGRYNR